MLRCNRVEYYAIQAEVFAYLDWVKTLAVGLIEAPDDDAEREDSSGGER